MDDEDDYDYDEDDESVPLVENISPKTPIEALREFMRGLDKKAGKNQGGVDGTSIYGERYTACHSPISRYSGDSDIVWSMSHGIGLREAATADNTRPAARAFYTWICGPESPWASITKDFNSDIDFVIECGFILGDMKTAPRNLVLNFFIATRFATEFATLCDQWYKQVQAGVAPWYAFWVSTLDGYIGEHTAFQGATPVLLLKGPPRERLRKPGGPCLQGDAIWAGQYWVPGDIYGLFKKTTLNTITGVEVKTGFTGLNPDFEALVAACIKEQEAIGKTCKEPRAA